MVVRVGHKVWVAAVAGEHFYLWNADTLEVLAKWPWSKAHPRYAIPNAAGDKIGVMVDFDLIILQQGRAESIASWSTRDWRIWQWHPSGECVVFVDDGGKVYSWVPGNKPQSADKSITSAYSLRAHPKDAVFAVGEHDGAILLVDAQTFTVVRKMKEHTAPVWQMEWNADGSRLASIDTEGTICIWESAQGALLFALTASADIALGRTPGGYCEFAGGEPDDYRLSIPAGAESRAKLYVPLGDLREVLHRPDKIAAALRGELGEGDMVDLYLTKR